MSAPPEYRLYTSGQITAASCFGSPSAGGYLLYRNAVNLARPRPFLPLLSGVAFTVFAFGTGFLLSHYVEAQVGITVPLVLFIGLRQIGAVRNDQVLVDHYLAGGRSASSWAAAGVAIISFLVFFGALLAASYAFVVQRDGTQFVVSPNEELYYRKGATEADAQAVADDLRHLKYFTGEGSATVYLEKTERGFRLALICREGAWENQANLDATRKIGDFISKNSLHAPVEMQMLDHTDHLKKTL